MCSQSKCACQRKDQLKGKPGKCSPEQIKICHGEGKGHPCVPQKGK